MQIAQKPMKKGAAVGRTQARSARGVAVRAQKADDRQAADAASSRRDFLGLVGLIAGLSAAQAAQAAQDPYEELKALSAARTGSTSLLESFEGTKGALSGGKVSRGIREKLAAEAAPQKAASGSGSGSGLKLFGSGNSTGTGGGLKPSATTASSAGPKLNLFGSGPKGPAAAAPKKPAPAAPKKPAAAASAGAGSSLATGPLLQAAGVLGVVGVGASVATSAATSKPKNKPAAAASPEPARSATPAAARAATPSLRGGTGKVQTAAAASSTGKVRAGAAASSTGKVRAGTPTVSAAMSSRPATPSLKSATRQVKKGAAPAAASGSTIKTAVKQALVNEEAPDEPTDFATGGFLGAVGLLAAFVLFGLPQPQVVAPTASPAASDPLVQEAKKAATLGASTYSNPLFKSATEPAAPDRKAIYAAPAAKEAAKAAAPAAKAPLLPPKPAAVVEAPKPAAPAPAAVVAPKVAAPAAAPKVAAPAAPAAAVKAPEAASASTDSSSPSAAQNLLVVAGGIAVVVTAFALTGGSGGDGEAGATTATSTPATAGAGESGSAAGAAAAAEGVSAAASAAAAAASAPTATTTTTTEGAPQQGGNAAYNKAVLALMADPEATEDLFSVMSTADASQRNIPALAWSLISTPSNAEKLDGFAFQKLSQQRYQRVRQVLTDAGLSLPDTPKLQPGSAAVLAPAGDVDSSEVDPEKLRGVFEALLANPASRTLMRQLLKGAGMPFNEEAFEEQVKDSNYFGLAIAPILRSMPQQKLRVLAELQDPEKLQQLVSSVSTLAQNDSQLQAVTAELSTDVKQTVDTIREAESRAGSR